MAVKVSSLGACVLPVTPAIDGSASVNRKNADGKTMTVKDILNVVGDFDMTLPKFAAPSLDEDVDGASGDALVKGLRRIISEYEKLPKDDVAEASNGDLYGIPRLPNGDETPFAKQLAGKINTGIAAIFSTSVRNAKLSALRDAYDAKSGHTSGGQVGRKRSKLA